MRRSEMRCRRCGAEKERVGWWCEACAQLCRDCGAPKRSRRRLCDTCDERARAAADEVWVRKWIAGELDEEQLAADRRRRQQYVPFPEVHAELRHHCGLRDWEIAKRLGVSNLSLLRRLSKHGITPQPDFAAMCTEDRRHEEDRKRELTRCA